jgi:hypothetical protein
MFTIHEEYQHEKEGFETSELKEEVKMEEVKEAEAKVEEVKDVAMEKVREEVNEKIREEPKNQNKIDFSWNNEENDADMEHMGIDQREESTVQDHNGHQIRVQKEIEDTSRSESEQENSDNDGIVNFYKI